MAQPYVGEIRLVGFNFAPVGWMFCSGQILPISEYDALYTLIGTTYGGDGQQTFGLPDLRGRCVVGLGGDKVVGQLGGAEAVTLTTTQIPSHSHPVWTNSATGSKPSPVGNFLAKAPLAIGYTSSPLPTGVYGGTTFAGGSQPHDNMQPFLTCNYIISLFGIYPTRS